MTIPGTRMATGLVPAGLALLMAFASPAAAQAPAIDPAVTGPVLTVLTDEDPQTQLMALILTRASLQQDVPVRVLLCSAAGDLALAQPPQSAMQPLAPRGVSPHSLLRALIEEGVTVQVCAIYLPNSPHDEHDLIEGVSVAAPSEIAAAMADPGMRFFTF